MNRFIMADAAKCIGCRTCEAACAVAHQDSDAVLFGDVFSPHSRGERGCLYHGGGLSSV